MSVRTLLLVAALATVGLEATARAADGPELRLDRDRIVLGLLHATGHVEASARIPEGHRAIFRLVGPPRRRHVHELRRVGGVLWIEQELRVAERVPGILLVTGWPRHPSREDLRDHGLGWSEDLREILPAMRDAGLYREAASQGVTADGRARVEFVLPDRAPPGVHAITLHVLDGDELVAFDRRSLTLERSALASVTGDLARDHGLLYGLAAVLALLAAGLLAGRLRGLGSRVQ